MVAGAAGALAGSALAYNMSRRSSNIPAGGAEPTEAAGVELLVHNLSHADMVVNIGDATDTGVRIEHKARPQFNQFQLVGEMILRHLHEAEAQGVALRPIDCESSFKIRYPVGMDLRCGGEGVDIGSDSTEGQEAEEAVSSLQRRFHLKGLKRRSAAELPALPAEPRITSVALPLVALLIPEWLRSLRRKAVPDLPRPRKVLVLVCGSGQPRDTDANPLDNSTEASGRIVQRFVELCYPDIEVVRVVSSASGGMFR